MYIQYMSAASHTIENYHSKMEAGTSLTNQVSSPQTTSHIYAFD